MLLELGRRQPVKTNQEKVGLVCNFQCACLMCVVYAIEPCQTEVRLRVST